MRQNIMAKGNGGTKLLTSLQSGSRGIKGKDKGKGKIKPHYLLEEALLPPGCPTPWGFHTS
jgi:hypothetical protein